MTEQPCEVPDCPAFAELHRATCGPHKDAALAKALRIAKDKDGRGGKRCITCGRVFAETDWVWKKMRKRAHVKKAGDHYGHEHVQCDPIVRKPSPKQIRESVKPLLEATQEPEKNHDAA